MAHIMCKVVHVVARGADLGRGVRRPDDALVLELELSRVSDQQMD